MSALHARVKFSLAWMYVADLVNHADFGRMVDGKGSSYPTTNVAGWLAHVANIIHDPGVMEHCPSGCAAVVAALLSAGYEIKKEKPWAYYASSHGASGATNALSAAVQTRVAQTVT